jgi:N-methylhydantoinase B
MPARDGIDSGGHFWIPDGIANNSEDVEAQYPLMVLSRRLLAGGADGAGRQRGGLGVAEKTMPRNAAVCMVPLHTNESFTKAQGVLGGNPGTRAAFRAKHGTDVHERFANSRVPASLDDLTGDEEAVVFKGAPVMAAAADVWEWTSPTTAGWGDPLRREPDAVLRDVAGGRVTPEVADRVYGVIVTDRGLDATATRSRRRALRRERLGNEPGPEVVPPAGARPVGDVLHVVDGRWWSNGRDLGPVTANYREQCVVRETPARLIGAEFDAHDVEMADQILFREYLCPVTGYRIDAELARAGEPPLHDIRLEG